MTSTTSSSFHYLRVPESAMLWGAYMTGIGRGRIPAATTYPPEGHPTLYQFRWARGRTLPEFAFIIVTEGRGVFESAETGSIPVPPNSLVTLFPGVWHRYRPASETGWTERWLAVNGELVHRLVEHHRLTPSSPVHPLKRVARLSGSFDRFFDRVARMPTAQSIVLSLRAMAIIAAALQRAGKAPGDAVAPHHRRAVEDKLIADAVDLIWTHSHRPLSVEQIAAELGVSRRTLERRARAALGCSVLDEIQACRVSRAKRLLEETDLPIKSVAYLAGFSNLERLRLAMTQAEGRSPRSYRIKSRDA